MRISMRNIIKFLYENTQCRNAFFIFSSKEMLEVHLKSVASVAVNQYRNTEGINSLEKKIFDSYFLIIGVYFFES